MPKRKDEDLRSKPMGPYAPPLPKEAESEDNEPVAVNADKKTHRQSFLPTSASLDAFNEDVATKYHEGATKERMVAKSDDETTRKQDPAGFTKTDARGFKHLDADEVEDEY